MAARNMYRIHINIHEKELCVRLVTYKDYTEMHGQQNIKIITTSCYKYEPQPVLENSSVPITDPEQLIEPSTTRPDTRILDKTNK